MTAYDEAVALLLVIRAADQALHRQPNTAAIRAYMLKRFGIGGEQ